MRRALWIRRRAGHVAVGQRTAGSQLVTGSARSCGHGWCKRPACHEHTIASILPKNPADFPHSAALLSPNWDPIRTAITSRWTISVLGHSACLWFPVSFFFFNTCSFFSYCFFFLRKYCVVCVTKWCPTQKTHMHSNCSPQKKFFFSCKNGRNQGMFERPGSYRRPERGEGGR